MASKLESDPWTAIVSFFHCGKCVADRVNRPLALGYNSQGELVLVCEFHDLHLHTFQLRDPPDMSQVECKECGATHSKQSGHQ